MTTANYTPPVCEVCLAELERRVEALRTGTGGLLCPHRGIGIWVWCVDGSLTKWSAVHPLDETTFREQDDERHATLLAAVQRRQTAN